MLTDNETTTSDSGAVRAGLDGIAIKPAECTVSSISTPAVDTIVIDYEGRTHLPDAETLTALAADTNVRVTTPVRADGFDPLGDDSLAGDLPDAIDRVLVAGHPAYLTDGEADRAVAPRLGAAIDRYPSAWVGTESVERIALATGGAQFELLSGRTERELRALRAAGFDGEVAVYAPTVLTDDADAILDAVGGYVARRRPVAANLPDGSPTDATATDRARSVLLEAASDYALVGTISEVRSQVDALRDAGASTIVGYPARGVGHLA